MIVVIGVLTAITIVSYNGIAVRTNNASRYTEMATWRKSFELYKVVNGTYPPMANGSYCLGTGFPGTKCRDYLLNNTNTYSEANSVLLMTQLSSVSPIPKFAHTPVNGTVSPYVTYGPGFIEITGVYNGSATDCPSGYSYTWDDGNGRLLCYVDLPQ